MEGNKAKILIFLPCAGSLQNLQIAEVIRECVSVRCRLNVVLERDKMEKFAVSVECAAEIVGCGRTLIYRHLNSGNLCGKKVGRKTLILSQSLKNWIGSLPDYQPRQALIKNIDKGIFLALNDDGVQHEKSVVSIQEINT